MLSNYPDGVTHRTIDALYECPKVEARVADACARRKKVAKIMRALDAAISEMQAERDDCPFAGLDFEDVTTSADLIPAEKYEDQMFETAREEAADAAERMWRDD